MVTKKLFNLLTTIFLLGCLAWMATSCSDDDDKGGLGTGTVSGIITDDYDAPLEGVAVKLEGGTATATTNANGEFTLNEVAKDKAILSFSKQNYQTISVTITPKSFSNGVALVNASMIYAAAKIYGTVLDGKHGNAPLAGVQVSISETQTVTTGADGTFVIDNLPLDAYTVTFTYDGYETVTRTLGIDGFIDGTATVDVTMGGRQILPHKTLDDLMNADHWFFSEYRGGRNGQDYPHFDWSTDFMATLDFQGAWEEQNEGTTLQIQNNPGDDQAHPADLNNFDSYVYGLKRITEDNKIMTIQCRTHSASNDDPAVWGVQVVDMSQASPSAVKLGENRTLNSEDYKSEVFDLSDYVGKDVIIAIGIYRARTGDYWKQFVLRRLAFNKTAVKEGFWGWLPGTAINDELSSWGLTQEMVRSAMPQTVYSFSGVSPMNGNRDNYGSAYHSWRDVNHLFALWSFVPLHKDTEPFAGEGFVMKTNGGGTPVSLTEPQAYVYAKFSIAAGHDHFTLRCRNFSSANSTVFKLTAITNDMAVKHILPSNVSANQWGEAGDGCVSFVHEDGGKGNPEAYATFTYDLTEFDGKDVTLCLGVYKGTDNGDENKLCIYSANLN